MGFYGENLSLGRGLGSVAFDDEFESPKIIWVNVQSGDTKPIKVKVKAAGAGEGVFNFDTSGAIPVQVKEVLSVGTTALATSLIDIS